MKKYSFVIITIILAAMIFSCSDSGFIMPINSEDGIVLDTIESGLILFPGEMIPLSLEYEEYQPDKFIIELKNADGEQLSEQLLEKEDLEKTLSSIALPELDSGLYKLLFTLSEEGELLLEREITFFYSQGEEYGVNGISVYPPVLYPGGDGILFSDLEIPVESDPFLRWSIDDTIISEGYLAGGSDILAWNAPEIEGVYSITLEIFPEGPVPGEDFLFNSTVYLNAEIFVSKNQRIGKNEFYPEDKYYSLYHFRGETEDYGYREEKSGTLVLGDPEFSFRDSVPGFYMDGLSGYRINEILLPFKTGILEDKGVLEPFSFKMRILFEELPSGKDLFRTLSDDESFLFAVSADEKGLLGVEFKSNKTDILISTGTVLPEGLQVITVSVVPGEEDILFLVFINEKPVFSGSYPYLPVKHDLSGYSVISGTEGVSGIIDEFGIFSDEGIDPDVYYQTMLRKYGNSLVYAEGFDGISVPDNIGIPETAEPDGISVNQGKLLIADSASAVLPAVTADFDNFTVTAEFSGVSAGTIVFESADSVSFLEIDTAGYVLFPESTGLQLENSEGILEIRLVREGDTLKLIAGDTEIPVF